MAEVTRGERLQIMLTNEELSALDDWRFKTRMIVENLTVRPLNAFRGFKPAPGQEPELNVQLDVGAWAYPETPKPGATPAPKST